MPTPIALPDPSEHAPYWSGYIAAARASMGAEGLDDVRALLGRQCDALDALVAHVDDARAGMGYAPGKWSLKESLLHVADTERIFAYRALRIGRGDATPLASFEQDDYVPTSRANMRTLPDVLAELRAVRGASMALVNSFDDDAIARIGTASGRPVSVRALCWVIAGHVAHHIAITRDRYLPALA